MVVSISGTVRRDGQHPHIQILKKRHQFNNGYNVADM
jgi:hypothetical protein